MKRSLLLSLTLCLALNYPNAQAADGSWLPAAGGNQDWNNTANWTGGVVANGVDASGIFNVNLVADQSIQNAGGQTVGHMFFQTTSSSAGGFNVGLVADVGSLTLDVTSGRSVIN